MKDEIINNKLEELSKSKFRNSFHLNQKMIDYIDRVGIKKIEEHTKDFVNQKLVSKPVNDGHQTPMKGHPTFIAMHSCACCCRECMYKWHHIPKERKLSNSEFNYIVYLLMSWIKKEYNNKKCKKDKL